MTTTALSDVARFLIPEQVVEATDARLREAGAQSAECFVLWVGRFHAQQFHVERAYVPAQEAHRLATGVCVTVDGGELHRLNKWLYASRLTLAVQVHTHPTRAYHSDTDSTYPIVTQSGGLSIVVPDFGRGGLRGRGVQIYRLSDQGWRHVGHRAAGRLVQISPA